MDEAKWREAEKAWRDLKPGDKVTMRRGDREFTDTVTAVHYSSGEPAIWPRLSWWQRVVRRLTPARWRKPLEPVRPYTPSGFTISTRREPDAVLRAQQVIGQTGTLLDGLLNERSGVGGVNEP